MAMTNYYVDSATGDDDNDGEAPEVGMTGVGPWETIERAFGDPAMSMGISRDATNGDQIHIKGSHTIVGLSVGSPAAISISENYGNPSTEAPLVLRGYGTTPKDGTRAVLDGNDGNYPLFGPATTDNVWFIDLELKDTGSSKILHLDTGIIFVNCKFSGTSNTGIEPGWACTVSNCHFTDIGSNSIVLGKYGSGYVFMCEFDNDSAANDMDYAIKHDTGSSHWIGYTVLALIDRCIMDLDGTSSGINLQSDHTDTGLVSEPLVILNCSIYTSGAGNYGITGSSADQDVICLNNAIEGFGNTGFRLRSDWSIHHGGNVGHNNTANFAVDGDVIFSWGSDEAPGSPFTDASANDWTASDAGNVEDGSEPSATSSFNNFDQGLSKGAAQRTPAGGVTETYYSISQGLHTIESGITA
jgi:hypothetical protein